MAGHLREAGKGALLTVLSRAQDWDMRHRLQAGETRGLLRYQQTQAWLGAVPGKADRANPSPGHSVASPEVMPQPAVHWHHAKRRLPHGTQGAARCRNGTSWQAALTCSGHYFLNQNKKAHCTVISAHAMQGNQV